MKVTSSGAFGQLSLLWGLGIGTRFGVFFLLVSEIRFFPVSPSLAISNSIKRHVGVPKEDEIEFSSFPLFYICEKGEGSFLDFRILLFLSISHAGTHSPAGQLKKRRGFMSIFFWPEQH